MLDGILTGTLASHACHVTYSGRDRDHRQSTATLLTRFENEPVASVGAWWLRGKLLDGVRSAGSTVSMHACAQGPSNARAKVWRCRRTQGHERTRAGNLQRASARMNGRVLLDLPPCIAARKVAVLANHPRAGRSIRAPPPRCSLPSSTRFSAGARDAAFLRAQSFLLAIGRLWSARNTVNAYRVQRVVYLVARTRT